MWRGGTLVLVGQEAQHHWVGPSSLGLQLEGGEPATGGGEGWSNGIS